MDSLRHTEEEDLCDYSNHTMNNDDDDVVTCIVGPLHHTLRASEAIGKLNLVVELCDLEIIWMRKRVMMKASKGNDDINDGIG